MDVGIDDFFTNTTILITGVTGFIGKILLEKLLRSQSNIKRIYVLVRPKKAGSIDERLKKTVFDKPIFETLKKTNANFTDKVIALEGNVTKQQLGLSDDDKALLLDEVNIVFNCAASTRMNVPLKINVNCNIDSVLELLQLCRQMKRLKSVVLVSTAYSNCNRSVIEEKIYETSVKAELVLKMCKEIDDDIMEKLTEPLLDNHPNTYTFSKSLMENMLKQYDDLPVVLFRPSIVGGSYSEPVPGWIDNVYGPVGAMIGHNIGILRVFHVHVEKKANGVPVDYCTNALICSAWHGSQMKLKNNEIMIYNYTGEEKKMSWQACADTMYNTGVFLEKSIWKPIAICCRYTYEYNVLIFFLHFLPALFIDAYLFLSGSKLRLNKIYNEKIYPSMNALGFFSRNEWTFKEDNTYVMWESLTGDEKKKYPFDMNVIDNSTFAKRICIGVKLYLLKEKMEDHYKAVRRHKILNVIHYTFLLLFWSAVFWIIYKVFL